MNLYAVLRKTIKWDVGEKRKSDDAPTLPEEDFYEIENVKQIKSKKFRMSATDYSIRFNNVVSDLDLIESYQRTQAIFEHLLNDVTTGMNDQDQVRFVLRSTQLDTPISMPFMARSPTYTRTGFLPN